MRQTLYALYALNADHEEVPMSQPMLDQLLGEISDDLRWQGEMDRAEALDVARAHMREAPRRPVEDTKDALEELEILRGAVEEAINATRAATPGVTGADVVDGNNHWMYEGGTQNA